MVHGPLAITLCIVHAAAIGDGHVDVVIGSGSPQRLMRRDGSASKHKAIGSHSLAPQLVQEGALATLTAEEAKLLAPLEKNHRLGSSGQIALLANNLHDLVSSSDSQPDSMSHGIDSISKQITDPETGLEATVQGEHDSDQADITRTLAAFEPCSVTLSSALGDASVPGGKRESLSSEHKVCRTEESALDGVHESCVSELAMQQALTDSECEIYQDVRNRVLNVESHREFMLLHEGEEPEAYLQRIEDRFCAGLREEYTEKHTRCTEATSKVEEIRDRCEADRASYTAKREICQSKQHAMDDNACSHATLMSGACGGNDACYTAAESSYDALVAEVQRSETERKHGWRGLQRIKCIVTAFTDGITDAEIKACQATTHSAEHLNINFGVQPTKESCTRVTSYPNTEQYKADEYSNLPQEVKEAGEASSQEDHAVILDSNSCALPTQPAPTPAPVPPAPIPNRDEAEDDDEEDEEEEEEVKEEETEETGGGPPRTSSGPVPVPAPTPGPPAYDADTGELGVCTIFGDPHVLSFDHGKAGDVTTTGVANAFQNPGDYWVVKTPQGIVSIQERYQHFSTVVMLVTGSFMQGHKLTIEPDSVSWDGEKIMKQTVAPPTEVGFKWTDPLDMDGQGRTVEHNSDACRARCRSVHGCAHFSSWSNGGCHLAPVTSSREPDADATSGPPEDEVPVGSFSIEGLVSARYADEKTSITDGAATVHALEVDLPLGVRIVAMRYPTHVDALIQMKRLPGGQDGHCGNFNGDTADDTSDAIEERVPGPLPEEESLIGPLVTTFMGCWRDDHDRDLPEHKGRDLSREQCAAECSAFRYFGRQYTGECFCGNSFGKHGKRTDCSCDGSNIGSWRNCVYEQLASPRPAVTLNDCDATLRSTATESCRSKINDQSAFGQGFIDACVFDLCFGGASDDYASEDAGVEAVVRHLLGLEAQE